MLDKLRVWNAWLPIKVDGWTVFSIWVHVMSLNGQCEFYFYAILTYFCVMILLGQILSPI